MQSSSVACSVLLLTVWYGTSCLFKCLIYIRACSSRCKYTTGKYLIHVLFIFTALFVKSSRNLVKSLLISRAHINSGWCSEWRGPNQEIGCGQYEVSGSSNESKVKDPPLQTCGLLILIGQDFSPVLCYKS